MHSGEAVPTMRILYAASRWDYGDRSHGPSFEEQSFLPAWRTIAGNVVTVDPFQIRKEYGYAAAATAFRNALIEAAPDLVFLVLINDELKPSDVRWASSQATTVNWFCDDHWRFDAFSRIYAPHLHLSVTTDPAAVSKYRAIGATVHLSQWACPFYDASSVPVATRKVASFVGQRYGRRGPVLRKIERAGVPVDAHGRGWSTGRVSFDEMPTVFRQAAVNLNFSDSWTPRLAPWRVRRRQLKARVFEILGCGGVMLTQSSDTLSDYFTPGVHCLEWRTEAECVEMVRYLVDNPGVARAMASTGQRYVAREHMYTHRLRSLLSVLGSSGA